MALKLFLASSTAARSQAKAFATALTSEHISFLPWWEAFTPGRTLLEELDVLRSKVHGAVLLLSPEAPAIIRGKESQLPNLNVLFEFGFFYGHFKKERVAVVKYGDFYLPSDLGGYIHIVGSRFFKRGGIVKVGKRTTAEFNRWVSAAPFAKPEPPTSSAGPKPARAKRGTIGPRGGGWVRNW